MVIVLYQDLSGDSHPYLENIIPTQIHTHTSLLVIFHNFHITIFILYNIYDKYLLVPIFKCFVE